MRLPRGREFTGKYDFTHVYPIVGKLYENATGEWWAAHCSCTGYIDTDYDLVITSHCNKHKRINRIKWNPRFYPRSQLADKINKRKNK